VVRKAKRVNDAATNRNEDDPTPSRAMSESAHLGRSNIRFLAIFRLFETLPLFVHCCTRDGRSPPPVEEEMDED
jgi:hypothetical protein